MKEPMKMNANPCKTVSEFEPLLNVREVAKLFGINHSTLLRMARSGHLPGVKIGRLWRFRRGGVPEVRSGSMKSAILCGYIWLKPKDREFMKRGATSGMMQLRLLRFIGGALSSQPFLTLSRN